MQASDLVDEEQVIAELQLQSIHKNWPAVDILEIENDQICR